jgi:hypothetical protein
MTTQTHAPSARPTPRSARLRRLAAVSALAPLLAVAACSGDEPITAQRRAATQAATGGSTGQPTTESATTTTATGKPTATTQAIKAVINDPQLGHFITPTKLVRNVPWPAGNPVGEENFEIVAVEVQLKAGVRYSADLAPWMLSITTDKTKFATTTTEFGNLLGPALVSATRGKTTKGWVYFKVDRGSGSTVTLHVNRPEYKVSTTGKTIPRRLFSVGLSA